MRKNKWLRRGVYFLVFLVVLYLGFWIALFNPLEGSIEHLQAMIPGEDEVEKGVTYCLHGPWEQIRKSEFFRAQYLDSPMREMLDREAGLEQDLYGPLKEVEAQINASMPGFLGEFSLIEDVAGKEVLLAGYMNGPGEEISDRVRNSPFVALTRISFKAKFMDALKFEFVRSQVPGLKKRKNYYEYDLVEGAGQDRPEEDRYRYFRRIKDVLILSNDQELIENVIRLGLAGGISEDCLAQQFYYYWDSRSPMPENGATLWVRLSKANGELGYRLEGDPDASEGGVSDLLRTLFPVRRTLSVLLRPGFEGADRIPLRGVVRLMGSLKGSEDIEGLHRNEAIEIQEEVEACAGKFAARGTFAFSWLKIEPKMFFRSFFVALLPIPAEELLPTEAEPGNGGGRWSRDEMASRLGDWFEEGVAVAATRLPEAASIDLDHWDGGVPKPLPGVTLCLKIRPELNSKMLVEFFTDNEKRLGWGKPEERPSPIGKLYELPLKADRSLALLKPAFATLNGTFLFSTNVDELRRSLEVISGKGEALSQLPSFAGAMGSVAKKGNFFLFVDGDRLLPYLRDQRYQHAFDATFFDQREFRKRAIIELTEENDEWSNERIQTEADRRVQDRIFTMKSVDFPETLKVYLDKLKFTEPFKWFAFTTTSSGDTGGPRLELKGEIRLGATKGDEAD